MYKSNSKKNVVSAAHDALGKGSSFQNDLIKQD